MARLSLSDVLDGYELPESSDEAGRGKKFICRTLTGNTSPAMLHFSRRGIAKLLSVLSEKITYISAKSYGAMSLSFGLITIILSFLADYDSATRYDTTISFIIGVVFALLSIPLLLTDKPFVFILQDFKLTDKILFEFLCINRVPRDETKKPMPTVVTTIFGSLLALLGFLMPAYMVLLLFFGVVFLMLALGSPEFSFLSTFFVLPYASIIPEGETLVLALVILTSVSFVRKVVSGKRVFCLEQYDVLVVALTLAMLITGIFVKGVESFLSSLVMLSMTCGYFLASNLITNRRLADCMLLSVMLSSIPGTVCSYVTLISMLIDGRGADIFKDGIAGFFPSADVCATFLIVVISFSFALVRQHHGKSKTPYIVVLVFNIGALILTAQSFAVVIMLLGALMYLMRKVSRHAVGIIGLATIALPYILVTVLSLVDPIHTGVGELVSIWGASLTAFLDNMILGIGMGADSFISEMGKYGIMGALDSSNLFIEIALEAGLFAFLLLVILLAVRYRHRTIYYPYVGKSQVSALAPAASVALICLAAYGAVHYIWSQSVSYYLFWCVFGLGSAALRVARKEFDDRTLYFEDNINRESSVIDVKIL